MEIKHTVAQILVGFFLFVLLVPLLQGNMYFIGAETPEEVTNGIASILWHARLPEIYLQTLFLGTSIIASLLVIRKPPKFAKEEMEKFGIEEEK